MLTIFLLVGITVGWGSSKSHAVPSNACANRSDWETNQGKNCAWVAKKPFLRCKVKGKDKTKANASCRFACDTCACRNSDTWRYALKPEKLKSCSWVQLRPKRCKKTGVDATKGKKSCRLACGTCLREGTRPTSAPSSARSSAPSAAALTSSPSTARSSAPSAPPSAVALWPVWKHVGDTHPIENKNNTCFENLERLGHTATAGTGGDPDYLTFRTDAWVSGSFRFGCIKRCANRVCCGSCYPFDGTHPDWSETSYLTFLARIEGGPTDGCPPTMKLRGRTSSHHIILQGSYVDTGHLSADEWRRVLIPMDDLKTAQFDLTEVWGIHFLTCGKGYASATYHIASLSVTDHAIELLSHPPSSAPSVYVTSDPLLATHRYFHHHWYPILRPETEPAENVWVAAENDAWPNIDDADPQTVTVLIPQDQRVIYSGEDGIKYDKIVVKGSLTIQPDDDHVFLTATTIVVEMGGVLAITTKDSPYTITIEIEGALDLSKDPQQTMVGIIALGGKLTIIGNDVVTKMAGLSDRATVGTNALRVHGRDLGFSVGGEIILPDTQTGLDVGHYSFPRNSNYVDQTEICTIETIEPSVSGDTLITCENILVYDHSVGSNIAYATRSIKIATSPASIDRGHLMHTGMGKFEVRNTRIENFGRTTTALMDNTKMSPTDLKFAPLSKQMEVTHLGTNQIARYALHAHHSMIEAYFTGNALLYSPRNGMVAHNSRVHILENTIVGADGTAIFLEDNTETGPVVNNYIIGTGGGSRSGDDSRFGTFEGKDMAHGGFGIWCRGLLAVVEGNHAEGHFGMAPYAFFVHPKFVEEKKVPDVPGTPAVLVGHTRHDISRAIGGHGLQLQSYGSFDRNTAVATFQIGLALSYFSSHHDDDIGSIINGAHIHALGYSGKGISTTHSKVFTLNNVTIAGTMEENTLTGIWCNSCNGCNLAIPSTNLVFENCAVNKGGNC